MCVNQPRQSSAYRHMKYLAQIRKGHRKDETADCIRDTATIHSKHTTWQSQKQKIETRLSRLIPHITYIHKNITVEIPLVSDQHQT